MPRPKSIMKGLSGGGGFVGVVGVGMSKVGTVNGGIIGDISIFGQGSNQATWRLCVMNLAIRGIGAKIE
jgi:type I restriction enzyme M protein